MHAIRATDALDAGVEQRRQVQEDDAVERRVRVVVAAATLALAALAGSRLRRAHDLYRPVARLCDLLL